MKIKENVLKTPDKSDNKKFCGNLQCILKVISARKKA
jgi:hypothetical protein